MNKKKDEEELEFRFKEEPPERPLASGKPYLYLSIDTCFLSI